MTPTTVRMVLVEGEKADGVTVDHDTFEIGAEGGSANVAEHVVSAVIGTKESAETGGHHLKSIGVTWSDHTEATALRDALTAHGVDDVMLVSEGHAAASLAQAVGRAVGYGTTALLFVNRDTATLSVVQTDDGSVVKVLSRTLHSADAMAVLTEMADAVDAGVGQEAPPQGIFVVGSGVDISSVKGHLEHLVSLPVHAPEDAELALARGAALASAAAPAFEATTVGLAYSQDPDGTTAGAAYAGFTGAQTELAPAGAESAVDEFTPAEMRSVDDGRKPFLLVGSALTSLFVIGVVALVISLAVSIRPTADQRPSPAQSAIAPSSVAPSPAPAPAPAQQEAAVMPVDPPTAETIKPPVPVVREAPQPQQAPRQVYVEQQAPAAPAPAPAAPPPPAPAPAAPPVVAPVVLPPPVVVLPRPQWQPPRPVWQPPWDDGDDDKPQNPWRPPWDDDDDDEPQRPEPTRTPQVPTVPTVPTVPQVPQWPGGSSGSGSNDGGSGRGDGGRGDGGSSHNSNGGSSRGGSSSGVPGDINGDGCFLVFCAPGGGRN